MIDLAELFSLVDTATSICYKCCDVSSSRRRNHQSTLRTRANEQSSKPPASPEHAIAALREAVDELKSDVLMLTRKVVSLEAELDHMQGKRGL